MGTDHKSYLDATPWQFCTANKDILTDILKNKRHRSWFGGLGASLALAFRGSKNPDQFHGRYGLWVTQLMLSMRRPAWQTAVLHVPCWASACVGTVT